MSAEIILRVRPNKALIIALLLELHLWDAMSPPERQAATERGEIWNTEPGKRFRDIIEAA